MTRYDYAKLDEFFNKVSTPKEMKDRIVDLMFRYALNSEGTDREIFGGGMLTLRAMYEILSFIEEKEVSHE